ncbi:porin [Paraburkholderia domus]|uniref:porin n=1 Tax=Paraburkholderia domus TaxID=2793075 RepID=UPI001913D1C8|nr:porin [Paraburkholderia domus]MBK5065896.1 porin [Burkholderia sp. R-70199]CAE6959183.1 Outer membrane porin protein [Paraburkholderia domus]
MKAIKLACCLAACAASSQVMAQSSVTLYGLIDTSIRYTTSNPTTPGSHSKISLGEGAFNGPRWGLSGTEDLGGGNSAIFRLESGFNIVNGKIDQQGQLFGRQAYVGLSNTTFGTLKFGRQYGALYSFVASVDPISAGNYSEDAWETGLTGVRYDNTVDYTKNFGPFSLEAQYSSGNQSGSTSIGRTMQVAGAYDNRTLRLGAAAQQSKDVAGRSLTMFSLGTKYSVQKLTAYAYYINSLKDPGFTIGAAGTSDPLANTSLLSNANTVLGPNTQTSKRRDSFLAGALAYQFTPALRVLATYMYDHVSNVSPGATGSVQTAYAMAIYNLSVRTDVYAEVDRSHLSGASLTDPNSPLASFGGPANRWGASIGMRHRF